MLLTVARIGRAHGLRGEVALEVRTDDPARRFVPGAELITAGAGPLRLVAVREQTGHWLARFAGVDDRTSAEQLRGVELQVEADDEAADDDEGWYRHELVGLRVERVGDHELLGTVIDLEHLPAQDLLVLREPDGSVSRVPFVRAIVPVVDVAGGRVLVDPPPGLLAADADEAVLDTPEA